MRQKSPHSTGSAEKTVRDIRRKTRRKHSTEEKIRIVLEGLRGDDSIASLCRREGIAESLYYSWSKEFLEAGKKRLAGDTAREATVKMPNLPTDNQRCRPLTKYFTTNVLVPSRFTRTPKPFVSLSQTTKRLSVGARASTVLLVNFVFEALARTLGYSRATQIAGISGI